nr:CP43k-like protein 1 [Chthamalus malayensis]
MNVWILLLAALGAVNAAPLVGPAVVLNPPVATKSKAKAAGDLKTVGNAGASVSGGSITFETAADQKTDANARVSIKSQEEGIGQASAASQGTSGVKCVPGFSKGLSKGDAATEGASAGQATTEADANGRAATICKGGKTDANSGSSSATRGDGKAKGVSRSVGQSGSAGDSTNSNSGAEVKGKAVGSAGTEGKSRGRAAAIGARGSTSISGSQTEGGVIGDGKVKSRQVAGAATRTDRGPLGKSAQSRAASEGEVQTAGPGASGGGESNAQARAGDGVTNSKSQTGQKLKSARDGAAAAKTETEAKSTLGLDAFGGTLFGTTKTKASGKQQSLGNANSDANAASTGVSKAGGGGTKSDSAYKGKTAGDGAVSGSQQSQGEGVVKLGDNKASSILKKLG